MRFCCDKADSDVRSAPPLFYYNADDASGAIVPHGITGCINLALMCLITSSKRR